MEHNKVYSVVFILSFVFMLVFLVVKLPTLNFDSSILSLIPKVTEDKVDEKIVDDFTKRLDKISLVVIKPQENNLDVVAKLFFIFSHFFDSFLFVFCVFCFFVFLFFCFFIFLFFYYFCAHWG